ncbi:MAG: polysaccharide biosynthesis/export family protein [Shimia sp.]
MHQSRMAVRALAALLICGFLAGCGVPGGAALVSEVTAGAEDEGADFAVYPVTKTFLPRVASWPVTGEKYGSWPRHDHGSRQRVIRPGDTIGLAVWDASDLSLITAPGARVTPLSDIRVSPSGSIFVPYVGNIRVSGNTPEAARAKIERAMDRVAPSIQVQLSMTEGTGNMVNLVGGTARPGRYPLPDNTFSVLDLIAQGGGVPTNMRNPKVKLHRSHEFYVTSVSTLFEHPDRDIALHGGDKVIIEEDDRYFVSLGAAGAETVHYFPKDFVSATDAVALSRGLLDSRADPGGVLVLRTYPADALGANGPEQTRVVFTIDLTTADGLFSARQFRINSEDLVYVTEAPVTKATAILRIAGAGLGLANAGLTVGD